MSKKGTVLILALGLLLFAAACGSGGSCEGVKSRTCCTEGHAGAPGDCADLIISHRHDKCAFVEEIEGCKPPPEWTKQPHGSKAQSWVCPANYEWVDDQDCAAEDSDDSGGGLAIPRLGTALLAPGLLVLRLAIRSNP
jgi:hypothetical protein